MKKAIVLLLCSLFVAGAALADIGVGYETFTILPHALTLTYRDKDSGWGAKASADFGTSFVSLSSTIITNLLSLGTVSNFSFYTLTVTKDTFVNANLRQYIKLGAMQFSYTSAGSSKSTLQPLAGYGWEKEAVFGWQDVTGALEVAYPELLTLGLKYYF